MTLFREDPKGWFNLQPTQFGLKTRGDIAWAKRLPTRAICKDMLGRLSDVTNLSFRTEEVLIMKMTPGETESHEHGGAQCKSNGELCHAEACRHDHHVSRHVEVRCIPVEGRTDRFNCLHEKRGQ